MMVMSENLSDAELRKALAQQVLQELSGVEVLHPNFVTPILVNRKGLKHAISRRYDNPVERLLALPYITGLLAKAVYIGKEADNHLPARPGIFIHRLQAVHEIEEVSYSIWLYVRETPNSLHFYDLGVVQ